MSALADLISHLKTGAATTCQTWLVTRKDGRTYGFTDHDMDLEFEGILFKANSGLTGGAMQLSNGLAVDNTEVVGSLSDAVISETDLLVGRFDSAEVVNWLVNWKNVEQRMIRFRGNFGEIELTNGTFRVELRGLTEALNQARGRVYQATCPAVLGDGECRIDLSQPTFSVEAAIKNAGKAGEYFLHSQPAFPDRWFERGRARMMSGPAEGLVAVRPNVASAIAVRRASLVHTDCGPGNLVRSRDGLVLIDWQCPGLGDPVEDIACFLSPAMMILYEQQPHSTRAVERFLGAYGQSASGRETVARYRRDAAAWHYRIGGYCVWREDRLARRLPDVAARYRRALAAEIALLQGSA